MFNINGTQFAITVLVGLNLISVYYWIQLQNTYNRTGQLLPLADRPTINWNHIFILICGLLTAAQLVNRIQMDIQQIQVETTLQAVRSAAFITAGLVVFLLLLLSEFGTISLKQFGITTQNWRSAVVLGTRGFLAAVLPVVLFRLATSPLNDGQPEHSLLKLLQSDQGTETIFWITFSAVVLAPLSEELLFRIILQGYLQQRVSPGFAIPFVAIVFSAVHPFPMSLALLPLAVILGYIYYRSHSYIAVVVTHALFNATNVLLSILALEPI